MPNGVVGRSGDRTTFGYGQRKFFHSNTNKTYSEPIVCSALKLRYLLPITMPNSDPVRRGKALNGVVGADPGTGSDTPSHGTPVTSPIKQKFKVEEFPILFDGSLVAKQGDGWDTMLEIAIDRWLECVVAERRGER